MIGTAPGGLGDRGAGSLGVLDDSGPITIGSIHPTSGALAGVGSLMDDGAKMAVDDINKAGGIKSLDGRKLKLSSGDSQGKAEVGQSEAQRMIDDGAVALVGTYQSDVTQNVASVAERGRVPLVIDVAVDDKILDQGYKYSFRVQPNATSMGTSGAESLAAIGKGRRPDHPGGLPAHRGRLRRQRVRRLQGRRRPSGITDVKEITYPPTNFSDATTQVREAAAYKPDVIVGDRLLPRRGADRQGGRGAEARHQGSLRHRQRSLRRRLLPEPPAAGRRGVLSANYHYDAKSPKVQDIRKRFEQKYGKPMETASVLSYQAVEVVAAGLEKAKDADPEKLREAISGVKLDEPLLAFDGPITFDKTGQNENATVIVMQNQNKTVAQVYPEEFAPTKIQFPAGGATGRERPRPSSTVGGSTRRERGSRRDGQRLGRRSGLAGVYLVGGKDTGLVTQADGHRAAARWRLRPGLDRADPDLRGARHRQLRPGGDAHPGDVPRLRAVRQRRAPGLRRHPAGGADHVRAGHGVQHRCSPADHRRQPRRSAAGDARAVPAHRQRPADGVRRPPQDGRHPFPGSVQVLGAVVSYSRLLAFVGAVVVARPDARAPAYLARALHPRGGRQLPGRRSSSGSTSTGSTP